MNNQHRPDTTRALLCQLVLGPYSSISKTRGQRLSQMHDSGSAEERSLEVYFLRYLEIKHISPHRYQANPHPRRPQLAKNRYTIQKTKFLLPNQSLPYF